MGDSFDIVVVGGGHAGAEAAAIAARLGRKVALLCFSADAIGRLSCNPAIGGQAKGTLVREIDALGGIMAQVADAACIQFRVLNTRKGLAVRSSRAQVDAAVYPGELQARLAALPTLQVIEGEAAGLRIEGGRVAGVRLADGRELRSNAVILTTGTFLRGLMHRGHQQTRGGRIGEAGAWALAEDLRHLGLRLGRLKTGTPPRLRAASVRWEALEPQDDTLGHFSTRPVARRLPAVQCFLAHTSDATHALIRENLHLSAMYSGNIEGVGPRYCPSIEDKVARFGHRERHQLFLEPEGLSTDRIYVNGLSTSLPAEIQERVIRSIVGLESAEIVQHGYAVEYDFADPRDLDAGLQHKALPGLFLAGQVNGTSGYEEAAAQGLWAGFAAATGAPLPLGRADAMCAVLVDDLVSLGVGGEPYRMFTSRAEHRLLVREDNADRRLMPLARELGLVEDAAWAAFEARREAIAAGKAALEGASLRPDPATRARVEGAGLGAFTQPATGAELMTRPEATWSILAELLDLPALGPEEAEQVETDLKYAGYIRREEARAALVRRMEAQPLAGVDLDRIGGLSSEVREKLRRHQPADLAAAARIPGVTPAAVSALAVHLAQERR